MRPGRIVSRYLMAILLPLLVVIVESAAHEVFSDSYLYPFLAAALLVAILGGTGPAIVCLLVTNFLIVLGGFESFPLARIDNRPDDVIALIFFDVTALICTLLIARKNAGDSLRETLMRDVSNERLRLSAIISTVPGVVWEAWGEPDTNSQHIDFVSDYVERMLGYSVQQWLSTPNFWLEIVHPDDREAAAARAADHFRAGGASTNVFRWLTRDGRALWVESHSVVIADDEGKPIGMRGVTMDISARKRAEESLHMLVRVSQALAETLDYQATLDAIAHLVTKEGFADYVVADLITDDGQRMQRVALSHRDPQMMPTLEILKRYPPDLQKATVNIQAFRRAEPILGPPVDKEMIHAAAENEEHERALNALDPRSFIVVPLEARSRIIGILTLSSSVPNRYDELDLVMATLLARRAALAIDSATLYRAALEVSRIKDEFLAMISHELRTPMTATLGWIGMLKMGKAQEDLLHVAIDSIERSTQVQAKLIEDILDVSGMVTGKFSMTFKPVDLREVVQSAIETVGSTLASKSMSLTFDDSKWSGSLEGDATRLQQVVWNLLSNAVKFGKSGGTIAVTLSRAADMAQLDVVDDGQGIAPSSLPIIFEPFLQGEGGSNRSHGGLGLGLSIARHVVEHHGGSIHARSDGVGKGSTFTLTLPLNAPNEATLSPSESGTQTSSGQQSSE